MKNYFAFLLFQKQNIWFPQISKYFASVSVIFKVATFSTPIKETNEPAPVTQAGASDTVAGIPGASDMLEIIFNERSKELYNETGDRFFNTRRLQRDILNESGNGAIPYSTYNSVLYVLIPQTEIDIHNMTQ